MAIYRCRLPDPVAGHKSSMKAKVYWSRQKEAGALNISRLVILADSTSHGIILLESYSSNLIALKSMNHWRLICTCLRSPL